MIVILVLSIVQLTTAVIGVIMLTGMPLDICNLFWVFAIWLEQILFIAVIIISSAHIALLLWG